ncbi:MAG: hypothetical protein IH840_17415 [Candidatus Heimdallarchaeota archaeon]|nr:hypothetical protein [Candidatus Heimdallarchaeota archaeon]
MMDIETLFTLTFNSLESKIILDKYEISLVIVDKSSSNYPEFFSSISLQGNVAWQNDAFKVFLI